MRPGPIKLTAAERGLTLIELMIGMVLGLLLLLGVINVFLAQSRAFRVNDNLAHMQDNARVAFELMAREIREAGGTPCGTPLVANVLKDASASWWLNWDDGGIRGYDGNATLPGVSTGTATAERVSGTDAVIVRSGSPGSNVIITDHNPSSAQFKVNTTAHGFKKGDILMACDYRQAAIFQATGPSSPNNTIVHNTGNAGVSPGNCTKGLGLPVVCDANGTAYSFENNGFLTRLSATEWYIGNNSRGGRSLYRALNGGTPQEIVEGVSDMQLQYLTRQGATPASDYVDASSVASWATTAADLVVAVRVTLTLSSLEAVGSDGKALSRKLLHVVSLRHREIVQ